MGITGDNLRKGRNVLRRINRNMSKSNSKADVMDMDMYRDQAKENLDKARKRSDARRRTARKTGLFGLNIRPTRFP